MFCVLRCVALRVMQLNINPEAQAVKAVDVMAAVNCKRIGLAVFYLIHGITLVAGMSRSLSCFSFSAVSLIVVIHPFVQAKSKIHAVPKIRLKLSTSWHNQQENVIVDSKQFWSQENKSDSVYQPALLK